MIFKFEPLAFKKVWGGDKLSEVYNIDKDNIGEIWGISAHKSASNKIINTEFKGLTLRELYNSNKALFGNYKSEEFPVLFKVIDAKKDLSIQVHPENEYAREKENSLGKAECWYILEADETTEIIIGHKAKNEEELRCLVKNENYDQLLNKFKINIGDYFYIPAGKVHAICRDTTLLEISQSSDITYRLYDYNRLDNGKLRDLHIEDSLAVIKAPDSPLETKHVKEYFDFKILSNNATSEKSADKFGDYIYVISGSGTFDFEKVKRGNFLMVSSESRYLVEGNLTYALINII
jgi:mannose-6-phosphate isomerase